MIKLSRMPNSSRKIPILASLLCIFLPGAGQLYNNTEDQRKIGYIYVSLMLILMFSLSYFYMQTEQDSQAWKNLDLWGAILSYSLSIASAIDAYRSALEINRNIELQTVRDNNKAGQDKAKD